jgi:hypothetical protein
MRPPSSAELERMTACLRAVPEFVRRRTADDTTPEKITVPVAGGEVPLEMSWIVL